MSKSLIRIAHISDFHVSLPVRMSELNLKRFFSRLNWHINRRFKHSPARLHQSVSDLLDDPPDIVLISGDISQNGLPAEFDLTAEILQPLGERGIPALAVFGNHDAYGMDCDCVNSSFAKELRLDLTIEEPGIICYHHLNILLLDQAEATQLFQAGGTTKFLGDISAWISEERGIIAALGHYPLTMPDGRNLPSKCGLTNASETRDLLLSCDAYFCGHTHIEYESVISKRCTQYCAGATTSTGKAGKFICTVDGVEKVKRFPHQ